MKNRNNDLTLFPDFERTHDGLANHDSSNYDFLNNSQRKAAMNVRNLVRDWSKNFPIDLDFVRRFTSKDNQEHKAAFFEIVIHEWLRRQKLDVKFQESQSGSSRRPDFTAYNADLKVFVAECALSSRPESDFGIEKLENQITDMIESIQSPEYFVTIDFEKSNSSTIGKRKVIQFVKRIISEGDPHQESLKSRREWTLKEKGWVINFGLLRKTKGSSRTLGAISHGGAQFINSERPLRNTLNRKRGRNYGDQSLPFIVLVNSSDFYLEDLDVMVTLYGIGSEEYIGSGMQNENGFYNAFGTPQNRSVSAVLIANGLSPWNLHDVKLTLWHNPWAANPLRSGLLDVDQVSFNRIDESRYKRELTNGRSLRMLLDINPTYLDD